MLTYSKKDQYLASIGQNEEKIKNARGQLLFLQLVLNKVKSGADPNSPNFEEAARLETEISHLIFEVQALEQSNDRNNGYINSLSEESNTLNQLNQIKKVLKLFDIAEDLKGKIENFGEELAIGVIETYGEKLGEKLAGKMGKYAVKGAVYTYKSKEDIAEIYKAGTCLHGDHFDMTSEKECVIERIENIRDKALEKTKEKVITEAVNRMLKPNPF